MSDDNVIHVNFGARAQRQAPAPAPRPERAVKGTQPSRRLLPPDAAESEAVLSPDAAKAALLPDDAEAARLPGDAEVALLPGDAEAALLPDDAEAGSHTRSQDPIGDVYSVRDAAKLFSLTPSRLRYWERSGFIARSVHAGAQRYYSFEDLIGIRAAKELLDEGVALQAVRRSIEALRASLPRVARPLSSLRIVAEGNSLLVRDDRGSYEPSTGQLRLDFEVSALRDDVVRVLRRGAKQNDFAHAYQHYLEGCRFDQDNGNPERAEAAYRRALELDPSLANAITNLGNLMYRRGRIEDAENFYIRALQVDPEQPEAFYNLGFLLYDRGDTPAAVLNFRRALRIDPAFADAHFNLAMALSDLEKHDDAREHWETYLKLDPNSPWAEIARRHLVK